MSERQAFGDTTLPAVLVDVLKRNVVEKNGTQIALHSHMSAADGFFLQELVRASGGGSTLEVGMAYAVSTLFICDALAKDLNNGSHIAIDPFQHSDWQGIGLSNVRRAGFESMVQLREERSEFALPALAQEGLKLDFALVDGWHSFDQALVEFFYIDRMLKVGGLIAFDDADWPGISKLMRFLLTMPHYTLFEASKRSLAPTVLGRLRGTALNTPLGRRLFRPEVRARTWELGIHHRCVAFRKTATDTRPMRFFEDF